MEKPPQTTSKRQDILSRREIVLALLIGVVLMAVCGICLFAQMVLHVDEDFLRNYFQIKVTEVPIYPNAKDISPAWLKDEDDPRVYKRSFSSSDTPDLVWQFYIKEMSRRWGFSVMPSPNSQDWILITDSCPGYRLEISSSTIEGDGYRYEIRFIEDPCI